MKTSEDLLNTNERKKDCARFAIEKIYFTDFWKSSEAARFSAEKMMKSLWEKARGSYRLAPYLS